MPRHLAKRFPQSPFPFQAGISARVKGLRAPVRCARLLLHLLAGLALALAATIGPRKWLSPEKLTRWWNQELLKILHVRVSVRGQHHEGAQLIACNHVSWLDIPVIAACDLSRFVSKSEVKTWPVAGWLATAAGTFYLHRGAGGTKQLVADLARHLRSGGSVTFFPEGTTTEGGEVLKFQPRLFAAAIETLSPVQPVALRYGRAANGENIAAFVGDDTLTANLRRLLRERELRVEVTYCAPILPQPGQDRAALAHATHSAICREIAPASLRPQPRSGSKETLAA